MQTRGKAFAEEMTDRGKQNACMQQSEIPFGPSFCCPYNRQGAKRRLKLLHEAANPSEVREAHFE